MSTSQISTEESQKDDCDTDPSLQDDKYDGESSPCESDAETTMREAPDTSIADLKMEMLAMRDAMRSMMDNITRLSSVAASDRKMPIKTTLPEVPFTTATPPAVATCPKYSMPNMNAALTAAATTNTYLMPNTPITSASTVPMQEQQGLREYKMPNYNYMPSTAAHQCVQEMPPSSLPYNTRCAFAHTTTPFSLPYTASQSYAHTIASALSQSTTTFTQPLPASLCSSAHPIMMPSLTSTNFPDRSTNANTSWPMPYNVNDSPQFRKLYDLPEFYGRPEQWPIFINSYRETTANYRYTNLENLIRLQKSLKGDARSKVEAFLIHPDSVTQIINTLEFHYGRPQVLIRSQIAKVRAFPLISSKRMNEMVNFSTMVSNLTTFLENANATPHLNNPTLLEELVYKLPLHKREEWMKHSINNLDQYPSVRDFSVWLHNVANYISLAVEIEPQKHDVVYNKKDRMNPSFTITTDDRLTKCPMCHQNHHLYSCNKFKETSTPDRWNFVKRNHLCFGCLRVGHASVRCPTRRLCGLSKCVKYHNRMLHEDFVANRNVNKTNSNVVKINNKAISDDNGSICVENDNSPVITITDKSIDGRTLFKFLPVTLNGPKGSVDIVAFIDEGSKITLLEDRVAKDIGLKGRQSNLRLGWIGGKTTDEISENVDMEIGRKGEDGVSFHMRNVWTTKNLKLPPQGLGLDNLKKRFPVLNKINIEDYDAEPKLLIGLPHIRLVRPHGVLNLDDSFAVHETKLGNIIFGSNDDSVWATVCRIDFEILEDIQRQVTEYFALENLGVKNVDSVVSEDDKRAEKILEDTTKKKGIGYETGLLWKFDKYEYMNTYPMALKRLQNVEAKMKNDKEFAQWYKSKICDYISKSYVRKLSPEECKAKEDRTWYLPHLVITNLNKENKRRLVFDAAACVNGESFNTRLMKGPEKYQPKSLLSILFKFRQRKFGVCADVKEMFHRVAIREEDQVAQRFLWRGGNSAEPPNEYVMQVMIFGSISSPCSAQYVKNMNAATYKDSHPKAYRAIVDCHYVDDYVDSFDGADEAIAVTQDVVRIQQEAGFQLRGFVSNSTEYITAINESSSNENDLSLTSICKDETTTEKILGMFWSPADDIFCFLLKFARVAESVLNGDRRPSKSEVLSLTMSIFDPFGFLSNMVIKSKILLQELWRYKVDWNMPIPEHIYVKWYEWYQSLRNVKYVKVPRCYGPNSADVDLHIFVDASEVAYAAVGYWRICDESGVHIVFIIGKSRCAPIKPLSIPRLELQAAILGLRLKESIIASHDIKPNSVTYWSDSKTVIKWIQSDSRTYKQFVAHRISEILESSHMEQWRWVPGSQNPADDATRPQDFSNRPMDSAWLQGPKFLKSAPEDWPILPDVNDYDCAIEKRMKFVFAINRDSVIPFEKYSCFYKLVRVMCWVRCAARLFKALITERLEFRPKFQKRLSVKDINETIEFLCRVAQHEHFFEEYNQLKNNSPVSKSSSIYKLTPFLGDDDLLRLSGRINNANCVDTGTKEPIILPKKHILTRLIVLKYHKDFKHQNQESICAAIRQKYWIPHLRQLVRSVKRDCQLCRNNSAAPNPPLMGQHPIDRLTPYVRPFSYTGIDYMGPFMVSIGRRCEKRWVALFTCLTVRAVHLEMARDLSTDAVILCIKNFINRRGLPVRMRSDRGTNFIGASKEEFAFEEAKVAEECTKRGMEWIFNAPANPSAGGAWERMVRSVKNVLAFTLKEKTPKVDTLQSLLIEAENLINSRPLTHLPIDSSDSEPLTPNHFLIGCPNTVQTHAVPEKVCLRKQWQITQQLKQVFWKRWVLEYLPDLTRRTKWYRPVKPLMIGDVVIVCDDNEARGEWKRGVIEEVFPAADGQVRSAVVRTLKGRIRRPASKLAVLDVGGESPVSTHGRWDVVN